jgi:hypothetical protein
MQENRGRPDASPPRNRPACAVRSTGNPRPPSGPGPAEGSRGRAARPVDQIAAGAKRRVGGANNDPSERACGRWADRIVRNPADV